MFFRRKPVQDSPKRSTVSKRAVLIEALETRKLMSSTTMQPDAIYLSTSATASTTVTGYTPAQIRKAYGFDTATLGSAGATADGAGQTIAIVDAYSDPNITSDLSVFDTQFGLAAANLNVVNQAGGKTLPATDAGWAGEISLDVEWAHAIAPGANILLVEANSSSTDDLMAAVNYARTVSSVSVISMSWGGSEYVNWANGGESSSQTSLDADFTTPSGHQGITFVAAAGDSGSQSGVQWPASSPNVLSVGGTTLTLNSDGSYSSESGWSGTSGGYSQVEVEPTYQDAVQGTGYRSTPDVAYDGDPNSGFAVYDSVTNNGASGWQDVGGTSAGSPQWAALIAIADQTRVLSGKTTLDGASQTLPGLYALYSTSGTSTYSTYTADFNDVQSSGYGRVGFGWGGFGWGQGQAGVGYDTVTGLGTPHAANVITALAGGSSTSGGGGTSAGGGSSGTTAPSTLPASPVSISFVNRPVTSVIGGTAGALKLKLTNTSGTSFAAPVTITLYASSDGTLSSDDTVVTTLTIKSLSLKAGGSKTYKVKFEYPTALSTGNYDVIASVQATGTGDDSAQAVSTSSVAITAPTVDLATSFGTQTAVTVSPGKDGMVAITVTNLGNVTAAGVLNLLLYASTTGLIDANSTLLASITNQKIKIRAGKAITFHLKFRAPPNLAGGSYSLVASATATTTPADTDAANGTAVIGTSAGN